MRRLLLLLWFSWSACTCRPDVIDPVELGFRVFPTELNFGRVLEGGTKTLTVTLTAETRSTIDIAVRTTGPFTSESRVELPGAGSYELPVTFRAGVGAATGVLELRVGEKLAQVPLSGEGVRPPPCLPSRVCVSSEYSLAADACIETDLPDDSPCDPGGLCLEQGRCRSGECLGVPRTCDDGDPCTNDGCSMELGCVNTPLICPQPAEACQVATCVPMQGCVQGPAPDFTPCGAVDCVSYSICDNGTCISAPTPDGVPCDVAIACLPEATCQDHVCTRETEGDWIPSWTAPVGAALRGDVATLGNNLFLSVCVALETDGGEPEDGGADGGGDEPDGGEEELDGGEEEPDGGEDFDGGEELDGGEDGGEVDAGPAPPLPEVCSLISYTGSGFDRFSYVYEDESSREVLAAGTPGVLLKRDGGLELRAPSSGELLAELPSGEWALGETLFLITDGGLTQWWDDAGTRFLGEASGRLARGDALYAWNGDAGMLVRVELLEDGGVDRREVLLPQIDTQTILTAEGRVVLPPHSIVTFEEDGGVTSTPLDAGEWNVLADETLAARGVVSLFEERCDGGPECWTWTRGVRMSDGADLFAGGVTPGRMVANTLVPAAGAVAVLMHEEGRFDLRVYSEGEELGVCHLPARLTEVLSATYSPNALVLVSPRADGGVLLESYSFGGLPVETLGWPTPRGVFGTKSGN